MNSEQRIDLTELAQRALLAAGFIPDYSQRILQEINQLDHDPSFDPGLTVRDMRNLLWFSIDNDDSLDLDQLTFAENPSEDVFKIYIAVAHVDGLVKQNSAVNARASQNTTSVYTPTKIFPMLPEKLSTNLTSLNPNVDRTAVIFEAEISGCGGIDHYDIYPALVHNQAKLAYNNVSDWLDGKANLPDNAAKLAGLADLIKLHDAIAKKLSKCRQERGALSFETIEAIPVFLNDEPKEIKKTIINRARLIIENFMIIANEVSALFSSAKKIPSLRRVVKTPRRWDRIIEVASQLGGHLPDEPDPVALEKFLQARKLADPATFPDLSLIIIKLLGNGEYTVSVPGQVVPGHFGLALKNYSHSTAPNRRYPDLVTQRLLLAVLRGTEQPYDVKQLEKIAVQCTQMEDAAEKIERKMRKSAAAMILKGSIGQVFSGIITGASEKGTWVRIIDPPVEGKIVKGSSGLDVGDRVQVKLVNTDVVAGFIDFVKM